MENENFWNSWRKEKDAKDLLPAGWKQQVGYEDLLHPIPAGSGDISKNEVGPKNTGVARRDPAVFGHRENVIPEGWIEETEVPEDKLHPARR